MANPPTYEEFEKGFKECLRLAMIAYKDRHSIARTGPSLTSYRLLIFLLKRYVSVQSYHEADHQSDQVVLKIQEQRQEGIDPYMAEIDSDPIPDAPEDKVKK